MAITAQEGKKLLEELGEKALLLDVRHEHEYVMGHIPGAVLLDNDDIEAGVRQSLLPEDLEVVKSIENDAKCIAVAGIGKRQIGFIDINNVFTVFRGSHPVP